MHTIFRVTSLLALLALAPVPVDAMDLWTLGLGGGAADRFAYRTIPAHGFEGTAYDEQFDAAWLATLEVGRNLSRHVWLHSDVGYLGYSQTEGLASTEIPAGTSRLSASYPSIGVGLRYYPIVRKDLSHARVYLQLAPTLYVSRWTERNEYPGYSLSGTNVPASVTEDAFTSVLPGFVAGAGFTGLYQAPVRIDIGYRFYYSANLGFKELGEYNSGDFKGLRQSALVLSLHKPL